MALALLPASALLATAVALGAAALLAACGDKAEAPAAPPEAAPPIVQNNQLRFPPGHPQLALLGTAEARAAGELTVELPARLVWNEERTARIYPAFAGRVTAIKADVGQTVKAGAPLALLASPDFGAAQADTAKARADASLAQQNLRRQRELLDAGIVARKDFEAAEADAARAQAEVARAQARTSLYGGGTAVNQQLALAATIGGVVVARNVNPGQELRTDGGGDPVFVVTDPSTLWVQIDARESDVAALRPGAPFALVVPSYPGVTFQGRVAAAADFIDPGTRTIKIRGVVANADRRLKAEMLATARVQEGFGDGVAIPSDAVTLRGTDHAVFVQTEPGVFEPRTVEIGHEGPREVIVTKGLKAGEKVAAQNVLLLARQFQVAQEEAGGTDAAAAARKAENGKEAAR
ncbi:efflux RND transporter periplasmic adaptor subunit [Xylophilus sp.]|uniref:efflux RND transporter periplasmic adaptor subunit n=1 Tax=Xylophilus sp. TaxID=2653893 RepID=UPI0013B9323A|nr:efflux RND transporter periplasmic adaptor subunit [Xylophilus sp.]KAF1050139.1 MAG: Cobalt-zinc-cadmium resistance protein CzcB [Xylophilus sp.]